MAERVDVDVAVIGGGIVGLATARALVQARPGLGVAVLEKEPEPARHQTGRNSGVIHSGLYYTPGSHKARLVAEGRRALLELCQHHRLAHELCGKVVVATEPEEVPRLHRLQQRGAANGVASTRLDPGELRALEPAATGIEALHVPSAGIVSFAAVAAALADDAVAGGAEVRTGSDVRAIAEDRHRVEVTTPGGRLAARVLVNCAGLHADRVAAASGADTGGVRIMPFRGEYYDVVPERAWVCNTLIYPVPDPAFPFLGVHLTRDVAGRVHAGPNAVPALSREGYRWRDVQARQLAELVGSPRTWRLARRYWRTGLAEIHRSLRRRAFVAAVARLCPELADADLVRAPSGVRAQAIDRRGRLLEDFAFADTARTVHVLNAPSPAATASLAIGRTIAGRVLDRLNS